MSTLPLRMLPLLLLLACAGALTACSRDEAPASADADSAASSTDDGFITRTTRNALDKARRDLAQNNISVGGRGAGGVTISGFRFGGDDGRTSSLPKAEISPAGDFLVDGRTVAIDAAQRELLLAHRANIVAIAEAGIAIGMQGAQLGAEAAKGAITSLLSGKSAEFEARMEAEGEKMEAEAAKLCDHLPALLASQQALAAALPAFQPYATMDATDVDDCRDGRRERREGRERRERRGNAAEEADAAAEAEAEVTSN